MVVRFLSKIYYKLFRPAYSVTKATKALERRFPKELMDAEFSKRNYVIRWWG